jgi:hypothetical protein
MKTKIIFLSVVSFIHFSCSAMGGKRPKPHDDKVPPVKKLDNISFYQNHYQLGDLYTKLINDKGDGYDDLYGLRNFRLVLDGLVYRGGGNNKYHKDTPKANMNPLPQSGLENLCKEGFSKAIYLYSTNYENAPKKISCQSIHNQKNELEYVNLLSANGSDIEKILGLVHEGIKNNTGPMYVHCWNGWHASGLVSAMTFMQFCGWDTKRAVEYWDKNTDGNNQLPGYEKLREQIRNFKKLSHLNLTDDEKKLVCP